MALFVNSVLTASYNAIYEDEDDTELILRVAPLSSNTEVQSLYTAGLIDFETALCVSPLPCLTTHNPRCFVSIFALTAVRLRIRFTGLRHYTPSVVRPKRFRARCSAAATRRRRPRP